LAEHNYNAGRIKKMAKQVYDEIQVLRSCAGGDSAAFEAIVSKYQSLVCAITYSAVGQVDKSEELAQQAFINAWQNLAQLQDLDMFKAGMSSERFTAPKNGISSTMLLRLIRLATGPTLLRNRWKRLFQKSRK
jgi:hypothetical protein